MARPSARTAPSASASIGSPSNVPVPCASTYWTVAGRQTRCPTVGVGQHRFLRSPAGCHQAVGASILVHRAAADHRVDRVAVGQRPTQRLEDDDAGALAADVAVGRGVEGLAAAVRRQHPGLREVDVGSLGAASRSRRRRAPASTRRRAGSGTPRWTATSDDEQAVSTAMLGPRKSKMYESRLAAMLIEVPVPL